MKFNIYTLLMLIFLFQCQEKEYVSYDTIKPLFAIPSKEITKGKITGDWIMVKLYFQEKEDDPLLFMEKTPHIIKFKLRADGEYIIEKTDTKDGPRFYGAGRWKLINDSLQFSQETPFPEISTQGVIIRNDSLVISSIANDNKSPDKPRFLYLLKKDVKTSHISNYSQNKKIIVFKDVSVVTMENDSILRDYTVITENSRIKSVGPSGLVAIPRDAYVIEAKGKYLMPGLCDMHVHFNNEEYAKMFVANGVTTVRNMWGGYHNLIWKKDAESNRMISPRIFNTGPLIDGKDPLWPGCVVIENRKEAFKEVERQKKLGYDFIKVYSKLNKESYNGILDAAEKFDIRVVGHVPFEVKLEGVIAKGQYSIEHLDGSSENPYHKSAIDQKKYAGLLSKSGTWSCPTLVVYQKASYKYENRSVIPLKYVLKADRNFWGSMFQGDQESYSYEKASDGQLAQLKELHRAGARLLLGTDTPNPGVAPGFSLIEELANFTDAGLTPYQSIKTGTVNAAEFLGSEEDFGTITEGKRADLILLKKNPLDDIKNISEKIGVMVNGNWIPKEGLERLLKGIEN